MKVEVRSLSEMKAAFTTASKRGLRWARITTIGLPKGTWHLTFFREAQTVSLDGCESGNRPGC